MFIFLVQLRRQIELSVWFEEIYICVAKTSNQLHTLNWFVQILSILPVHGAIKDSLYQATMKLTRQSCHSKCLVPLELVLMSIKAHFPMYNPLMKHITSWLGGMQLY